LGTGGVVGKPQRRPRRFLAGLAAAKRNSIVPRVTVRSPNHSRADDAQKGQNGNSIRVFGARFLRRLHGRTVTDGLFQEKVTAQRSAADA
jgi:hypothetical protein